jgi:hypothetical protein
VDDTTIGGAPADIATGVLLVNVVGVPVQVVVFKLGVTVMVPVTGVVPVLVAINDPMLPVPLAARPIDGVLFTQL